MRRVVVTGLGLLSPLGCGTGLAWARLLAGRSGIRRLPDAMVGDIAAKIGGVVPSIEEDADGGFDPDRTMTIRDRRRNDRFIQFAVAAAAEALGQAGWAPETEPERQRTATVIATGIGGFETMMNASRTTDRQGPRHLSPFTVPSFLVNLAAGQVSIRNRFRGPIGAPVTACAASLQAIGDAARLIRCDEADIAICGGTEACLERVSLGSFAAASALSTAFNDRPEAASRPFDMARDGFVMSEGAAMLVIESLDHAQARGATPLAEIIGYGTSSDGHHVAATPPDGEGVARAMRLAIRSAGIEADRIGYINAHATATALGDAAELTAIRGLVGPQPQVRISSTKSSTGHMLGAAGATGAIFSVMALRSGMLPPNLNLADPDPVAGPLHLVGPQAESHKVDHAMTNGFGFGGVNASLVFRRVA